MKNRLIYILILLFGLQLNSNAQTGTDFWFVVPEIAKEHNDNPILFAITARDFAAEVTIEMPANGAFIPIVRNVGAFSTDLLSFTDLGAGSIFRQLENTTLVDQLSVLPLASRNNISNKALHITSTAPINIYFTVNPASSNNSDIYALKGNNGIGTEFIIPFQDFGHNQRNTYTERAFSKIDVIAVEDVTIEITTPVGKSVYRSGLFPNFAGTFTVNLLQGQVYSLPPFWDPSVIREYFDPPGPLPPTWSTQWWAVDANKHFGGIIVKVLAGKGVAIVKTDDSVQNTASGGGWDIIGDQWVPYKGVSGENNDILGTEYVAMRGALNAGYEKVFVAAPENNTRIWWGSIATVDTVANPVPNTILQRGQQVRIDFNDGVYPFNFLNIVSNNPLSVLHVSGSGSEMGGAVVPPIDYCTGSNSVTFARSMNWPLYLNIMVWKGGENGFLVQGVKRDDLIDPLGFKDVGTSGKWVAQQIFIDLDVLVDFPVNLARTISNKQVFHLGLINGGKPTVPEPGCRYGYFSDFNRVEVSALTIQGDGIQPSSSIRACKGDTVQLYSGGGSKFKWWPSTGLSSDTVFNPRAVVNEFRTYFVEVSGACDLKDTATVTIEVLPQPDASFMLETAAGCAPLDIEVRNLSTLVSRMYWDFNNTSIGGFLDRDTTIFKKISGSDSLVIALDTVISHSFVNTSFEPTDSIQTYTVQLKVKSAKCYDSLSTTITVYPEVTASFTLTDLNDTLSCSPASVDFLASLLSINEDFYKWDFGDGALSADPNPSHNYYNIYPNQDTSFTAQLVVRSQWFCRDTARMNFTVHPYLEGGFGIDKDKGCSPFNVRITNLSSGADSIFLDYGDGTLDTVTSFNFIDHFYVNDGTIDKVDTNIIVMRVKNNEGCEYIDRDTIIVYPQIRANYTIDGPGNYLGCNSRNVLFINTSNYGTHTASQFLWTFGDGTNSNIAAVPVPKTYNNLTTNDQIYTFNLRAESQYGCFDDTTYQIRIDRAFADFTTNFTEGCAPLSVTLANTSVGNQIINRAWSFDDGSLVDNNITPVPNPHIYTNTTGDTLIRNLQLTVTGSNGCSTNKITPITVHSEIDLTFLPIDQIGCDSMEISFNSSIVPIVPGTLYQWNFGDGTSSSVEDPTHIYRNLGIATDATYPTSVQAQTPQGCIDSENTNIVVHPYVKAKFTTNKVSGCSPLTVDPIATYYVGINQYRWDYGDGTPFVYGQNPPAHTYPANASGGDDTYILRLDVFAPGGVCPSTTTKTITVFSEAIADFDPKNSTSCNPYTLTFDNLSFNAATYKWDFGDFTTSSDFEPIHTFTNISDALVSYNVNLEVTSNKGCINTFNSNVSVNRYVFADFDIDVSEGCSPVTVHVKNNSRGGTYYWFWDDDDLTLATRDRQSTLDNDEFDVTYTNILTGVTDIHYLTLIARNSTTGNCYDTLKIPITVHPTIDAQYTYLQASGCNPSTVVFTNTTTNASTYIWTYGDGTTSTQISPTKIFTNNTFVNKPFNVKLRATSVNGCVDSLTQVITVFSKVVADFSIDNSEGCPPFNTSIENTSLGNPANTYQWLIDNVPVGGSPTDKSLFNHTYANLATSIRNYAVKLIATNPHTCASERVDNIKVFENVHASYSMNFDKGCNPLDVAFTDISSVPPLTKYTWIFGDGATSGAASPTHKFYNSSRTADLTYTTKLVVQSPNFCTDDTSQIITVYHQPLAKFFIDKTTSCPPLLTNLIKESQGEDMFQWRFGDGNTNSVNATLSYSYPNVLGDFVQYYTLTHWVATNQGCKDSTSLVLSVYPDVVADFNYDAAGCSPFASVFTNTSSAASKYFLWNFDDGSTSNQRDPVHGFNNTWPTDRTFRVLLTSLSEYNCRDTISKPVTVFTQPIAGFDVSPVLQTYPENEAFLDNKSNAGPFNYLWEFGDGLTSNLVEPNVHVYDHWGEKDIKLTITSQTSSCIDDIMKTITILPPAINAAFTTNISEGCLNTGFEVDFTAAASAYSEVYTYEWEFGDGSATQYGQNISHTYTKAGVYYVKLTASGESGEDYEYKTIRVYSNPKANFEVSPKVVMLNTDLEARVEFFNLSECNDTSGCSYLWDFGNGKTSIARDVTHNYTPTPDEVPIKYDISLYVTTAHGCRDSLILIEEVEIIGAGQIEFPNAFTPNGDGLNDTFRPVSEGVIQYDLLLYNRWGELIFKTNDLSVGWNGTIKGNDAKPDVYVWKAQGKFSNGRAFEMAGDVTLIR